MQVDRQRIINMLKDQGQHTNAAQAETDLG